MRHKKLSNLLPVLPQLVSGRAGLKAKQPDCSPCSLTLCSAASLILANEQTQNSKNKHHAGQKPSRRKNKPFICFLCLKPDSAQLDTFAVFLCFCRWSSLSVSSCPTPILTTLFLRYSQRWFVFSPFIKQPGLSVLSCLLSEMLPLTFHGSFSFPSKILLKSFQNPCLLPGGCPGTYFAMSIWGLTATPCNGPHFSFYTGIICCVAKCSLL